MITQLRILTMATFCLLGVYSSCQPASDSNQDNNRPSTQIVLKDGWNLQSSLKVKADGATLTSAAYQPTGWFKISVPSTIIGGLMANDYYDFDPFMGQNFKKLADPAMDKPWWFRKAFTISADYKGKNIVLKLQGINYKANVWLNGHKIADSTEIKGPMRIIDLDITKYAKIGDNVLALQIQRPFRPNRKDGDLAIDYADWIHYPPDYNAGIINDVVIHGYDKVGVQYPHVVTHFDLPSLDIAHLTVHGLVTNYTDKAQQIEVRAQINKDITIKKKVSLAPGQ